MSNLIILILNVSFSNPLCALSDAMNAKNVFLFFSAMACDNVEYVIIIFQNTSVEILLVDNHEIILNS